MTVKLASRVVARTCCLALICHLLAVCHLLPGAMDQGKVQSFIIITIIIITGSGVLVGSTRP